MSKCKFCESLESYRKINEFRGDHSEFYGGKLLHEYKVALMVRSWTKGNKSHAGRITDYRYRGCGYDLNYCPECGRKL